MRDDVIGDRVGRFEDIFIDDVGVFDPFAEVSEFDANASCFERFNDKIVREGIVSYINFAGDADGWDFFICADFCEFMECIFDDLSDAKEVLCKKFDDDVGLPCGMMFIIFDDFDDLVEGIIIYFLGCARGGFDGSDFVERGHENVAGQESGVDSQEGVCFDAFGVVGVRHGPDTDAFVESKAFQDDLIEEVVAAQSARPVGARHEIDEFFVSGMIFDVFQEDAQRDERREAFFSGSVAPADEERFAAGGGECFAVCARASEAGGKNPRVVAHVGDENFCASSFGFSEWGVAAFEGVGVLRLAKRRTGFEFADAVEERFDARLGASIARVAVRLDDRVRFSVHDVLEEVEIEAVGAARVVRAPDGVEAWRFSDL